MSLQLLLLDEERYIYFTQEGMPTPDNRVLIYNCVDHGVADYDLFARLYAPLRIRHNMYRRKDVNLKVSWENHQDVYSSQEERIFTFFLEEKDNPILRLELYDKHDYHILTKKIRIKESSL